VSRCTYMFCHGKAEILNATTMFTIISKNSALYHGMGSHCSFHGHILYSDSVPKQQMTDRGIFVFHAPLAYFDLYAAVFQQLCTRKL
jgi:hypothetical protein